MSNNTLMKRRRKSAYVSRGDVPLAAIAPGMTPYIRYGPLTAGLVRSYAAAVATHWVAWCEAEAAVTEAQRERREGRGGRRAFVVSPTGFEPVFPD